EVEIESRHDVDRRRQLQIHLEERGLAKRQIEPHGHARGGGERAVADPDATARADVPVEVRGRARDDRILPEVVHVHGHHVAGIAVVPTTWAVYVRAAAPAVAPETEAEIQRVASAHKVFGDQTRRVTEGYADAEVPAPPDFGRLCSRRQSQQQPPRTQAS